MQWFITFTAGTILTLSTVIAQQPGNCTLPGAAVMFCMEVENHSARVFMDSDIRAIIFDYPDRTIQSHPSTENHTIILSDLHEFGYGVYNPTYQLVKVRISGSKQVGV